MNVGDSIVMGRTSLTFPQRETIENVMVILKAQSLLSRVMRNSLKFKFQNYAFTTGLLARPNWKCDKCMKIFSGYNKLKLHKQQEHAYVIAAAVVAWLVLSFKYHSGF